jgi:hypothetical protein
MALLYSEFFWGIVVGAILTAIGSILIVSLTERSQRKQRFELVRTFSLDTVQNISQIIRDLESLRVRTGALQLDFLALLEVEIGIFGRNREHIIALPSETRRKLREFMNNCAIKRAEIANLLGEFYRQTALADQLMHRAKGHRHSASRTLLHWDRSQRRMQQRTNFINCCPMEIRFRRNWKLRGAVTLPNDYGELKKKKGAAMCHASFAVLFHFRRSMPEAAAGPAERRLDDAAGDRMIACLGRPHLVPAVSASQTSSTPELKLYPSAANESTIRADARRRSPRKRALRETPRSPAIAAPPDMSLCPLLPTQTALTNVRFRG